MQNSMVYTHAANCFIHHSVDANIMSNEYIQVFTMWFVKGHCKGITGHYKNMRGIIFFPNTCFDTINA